MRPLGPTRHPRLNEAAALVYLAIGVFLLVSLSTYHPTDPSWNTAASANAVVQNRMGRGGSYAADFLLQVWGLTAFIFPFLLGLLAWKWVRSADIELPVIRGSGYAVILLCLCAGFGLMGGGNDGWKPFGWRRIMEKRAVCWSMPRGCSPSPGSRRARRLWRLRR